MYTSYSPNDERFGFRMTGSFKCAYENERIAVVAFLLFEAVLIVSEFIIFGVTYGMVLNQKPNNIIESGIQTIFGFDMAVYGSYVIAMAAILCVIVIAAIAFLYVIMFLRAGKTYKFIANENYFEIIPPDEEQAHIVVGYSDVIMVYGEERRFLFTAAGMDITVRFRDGSVMFRYIHTPISKANGLDDTPFNIIRERSGLLGKPDDISVVGR